MNEIDIIINKVICNEKSAIKDQFVVIIFAVLIIIISGILLSKPLGKLIKGKDELPFLYSILIEVVVGSIAIYNPVKEINDRRGNIRNIQTIQYACNVILEPNEEEKCFAFIIKYL